ncbi:MAG: hypothetical protein IH591_07740, partial [Bacteroidales bacterium]|nr:hypothetical protein [Bacteroidales bacterium]
GFAGGFFLNERLPWTPDDVCFTGQDGDILVLVSGAVYNRDELSSLVDHPGKLSDPALIAGLFIRYGPEFVSRLNGDFAIFIWQAAKKEAYLFRDHAGIRPLAWIAGEGSLSFSSDTLGLCRAFSNGRDIERGYLSGYFRYIDNRKTPDREVKKLLSGHYLHFSEKGVEITKYWHPERIKTDKSLTWDQMLPELDVILKNSVRIRCDSRFTAGAHVSSGLDSAMVAGLAVREFSRQESFFGFSWSPCESDHGPVEYDERDMVRRFCEKAGITPVFSDLGPVRFTQIISSFYGHPALFYEERTAEQAAELGVNLLFSGWGGDEFISTGDRGVEQDLLAGLKLRTFFRRNPVRPFRRFIRNQLLYVVFPALGILDRGTAKSFREDARYLKEAFRKSDRKAIKNFYFHTSRHQLHLRMLQFYHLQRRCENWMIIGYREGVEYRYPLLDRRIIEYMLRVPSELLCRTALFRPLLRELGRDILTEEIRLNNSKADPVSMKHTWDLLKVCGLSYMDEVAEWRHNPDLDFIDFGMLDEDIRAYRESAGLLDKNALGVSAGQVDENVLFKTLVNIKAVHEFSKNYAQRS